MAEISSKETEMVVNDVIGALQAQGVEEQLLTILRKMWVSKLQCGGRSRMVPSQLIEGQCGEQAGIPQVDGPVDTSDEEEEAEEDEDDDDDDDDDDSGGDDDLLNDDDDEGGVEEDPLGSNDDISDEDPTDLFNTENVVVCQFDKITRARNKWKFHLKDGIMHLNGQDYVFQKANGDAEW